MNKSAHFDDAGEVRMVDVSEKPITVRTATASATIQMSLPTAESIRDGGGRKGDVLQVARIAAINGVKQTASLIPLCHPLPIDGVSVVCYWPAEEQLTIEVTVTTTGRTGVEMEALTGAATAALTVYDMCKSIERGIEIRMLRLIAKDGGASGSYRSELR